MSPAHFFENNMRTLITSILLALSTTAVFAQEPIPLLDPLPIRGISSYPAQPPQLLKLAPNSSFSIDNEPGLVSERNFPSIFNENVTFVLTGDKNVNTWGNFISVNVVKPTATLAFSNVFYNKGKEANWIVSGSASGAVDQDILSIFSTDKLNTSVELRANAAYITRGPFPFSKFFYTDSGESSLEAKLNTINDYYDAKGLEQVLIIRKMAFTIDSIKGLEAPNPSTILLRYRLESTLAQLRANGVAALAKARLDSITKTEQRAEWSTIRISWIDFFGAIKQQKVNLYDALAPFLDQVQQRDFTQFRFGTAYNIYVNSTFGKYKLWNGVYRLEYTFSSNNNSAELDTYDVSTSGSTSLPPITGAPTQTRQYSRKVSAYMKYSYVESYFHTVRLDILKQLTNDHRAYLHLIYENANPSQKITRYTGDIPSPPESIKNLTVGFLVAFTNKDKPKSLVNIEPYVTFRDLSNSYAQNATIRRGREIGIRTTFPFGLPTKSK